MFLPGGIVCACVRGYWLIISRFRKYLNAVRKLKFDGMRDYLTTTGLLNKILFFRKVPKEFHLDYDKLEDRPSLASAPPGSGASPGPPGGSPGPIGPQSSQQGGL